MITYTIAGLISVGLAGGTVFLGHRLFPLAFTKGTGWAIGMYLGWILAAFVLAFLMGGIGRVVTYLQDGDALFGLLLAIICAGVFLASVIYPWFLPPYTIGLIIVRVLGSFLLVYCALWAFLMVGLISGS